MSGYSSPLLEKYYRENNLNNNYLVIVNNCAAQPMDNTKYGGNICVWILPSNTRLLLLINQKLIATTKTYCMDFTLSVIDKKVTFVIF